MSYYKVCPSCGSHLDPGEVCECKENAAASAANTDNGGVEQIDKPVSTSIISENMEDASMKYTEDRREDIILRINALTDEQFSDLFELYSMVDGLSKNEAVFLTTFVKRAFPTVAEREAVTA